MFVDFSKINMMNLKNYGLHLGLDHFAKTLIFK